MHRGIMVYGPEDRVALAMLLRKFGEENRPGNLVLCHRFPEGTSAGLMVTQVMEMIQNVESDIGKDFCDSFIVMPEEDATPPWYVDYGPASYVLTYKKGHDYCLYAVHRTGLWDWWVPGGRWATYLKPKDTNTPDAHMGGLPNLTLAMIASGIPGSDIESGTWSSLTMKDVDWKTMEDSMPASEEAAVSMRAALAEKGITVPTFREYFHELYPALRDQVAPEAIDGYIKGRWLDTYCKFRDHITALRVEHGFPDTKTFSMEEHRFSDALLERLGPMRAKTLSAWIVGGEVYDLDDLMATEEHLHKGLDAIQALSEDTIVSVVDVHY